ncbi:MAG: hypothetical protein RLY86_617 [Pseudomonadota bacterium]|jgi:hypothetical protein
MPTEIRHIIFTQEEVVRGAVDYHRRSGSPLPTGSIIKMVVEKEPALRIALHIALDADDSRAVIWIEHQVLAAALIFFCIQNRIPLPTKAAKELTLMGEKIALVVTKSPVQDGRGRA